MAAAAFLIERLDRALEKNGQDVVLRRTVGSASQVNIDVTCRAMVRDYAPQELVGQIIQGDSHVIISPTQITAAQWPGGQPIASPPVQTDPRVPRPNQDKVIVAGRLRNVQAATPIYVVGELVRIEMQVRG